MWAPAMFQRIMDSVLAGTDSFPAAYLDDIVVYSTTWEEHLHHLGKVLQRIERPGLTVHPRKCAHAQEEVSYLGHVFGQGVIRTKNYVRPFLSLVGWYRQVCGTSFVPGSLDPPRSNGERKPSSPAWCFFPPCSPPTPVSLHPKTWGDRPVPHK